MKHFFKFIHYKLAPQGRTIAITQQEISEMVGMTRESINKQLRAWAARDWVRLEHGAIVVLKRVNANTIDSTSTVNGKELISSHTVISADGKTLTRVSKGVNAAGQAFENTEVYERK